MSELFRFAVFLLCLITSLACARLLGRSYARTGMRLLLWSSLSFAFLAVNNALVIVDLVILPDWDLQIARLVAALAAIGVLLYGLIMDLGD